MRRNEIAAQVTAYRRQIADLRTKIREAEAAAEPEEAQDYAFATPQGTVRLSALFDRKGRPHRDPQHGGVVPLLHAVGRRLQRHLPSPREPGGVRGLRPDRPDAQAKFAARRGWRFPMVSNAETTFAADMGYRSETGGFLPGITTFRRDGGRILRVSDAGTGPDDEFCALWHLFDLLPGGAAG